MRSLVKKIQVVMRDGASSMKLAADIAEFESYSLLHTQIPIGQFFLCFDVKSVELIF
jgi:hypothetical protein